MKFYDYTAIEHAHWILCGTGPRQDEYHVKRQNETLFTFTAAPGGHHHVRAHENASRLREWYIQWEFKRLVAQRRDASGA